MIIWDSGEHWLFVYLWPSLFRVCNYAPDWWLMMGAAIPSLHPITGRLGGERGLHSIHIICFALNQWIIFSVSIKVMRTVCIELILASDISNSSFPAWLWFHHQAEVCDRCVSASEWPVHVTGGDCRGIWTLDIIAGMKTNRFSCGSVYYSCSIGLWLRTGELLVCTESYCFYNGYIYFLRGYSILKIYRVSPKNGATFIWQ